MSDRRPPGVTWEEVLSAVGETFAGRSVQARRALVACWDRTAQQQHAHRCVIAHYLADQQADLETETDWDERALHAHGAVGEHDLAAIGVASARAFLPSLHLNLGDDYLRLGRVADAGEQLRQARAAQTHLGADGYGTMIRSALDALGRRIDAAGSG